MLAPSGSGAAAAAVPSPTRSPFHRHVDRRVDVVTADVRGSALPVRAHRTNDGRDHCDDESRHQEPAERGNDGAEQRQNNDGHYQDGNDLAEVAHWRESRCSWAASGLEALHAVRSDRGRVVGAGLHIQAVARAERCTSPSFVWNTMLPETQNRTLW